MKWEEKMKPHLEYRPCLLLLLSCLEGKQALCLNGKLPFKGRSHCEWAQCLKLQLSSSLSSLHSFFLLSLFSPLFSWRKQFNLSLKDWKVNWTRKWKKNWKIKLKEEERGRRKKNEEGDEKFRRRKKLNERRSCGWNWF